MNKALIGVLFLAFLPGIALVIDASRAPKLSAARNSRGFSKGAAAVSSALAAEDRQ